MGGAPRRVFTVSSFDALYHSQFRAFADGSGKLRRVHIMGSQEADVFCTVLGVNNVA